MERTRTKLLLLLMMGLPLMAAVPASPAANGTTVPPTATAGIPAAPGLAAAGETPCSSCVKCPCACSPLAGAWVARFTSDKEAIVHTFKFQPVNAGCTRFAVNVQAAVRSAKVLKCWPEACDLTEFVGLACKDQWNDMRFTAIGYGVKHCDPNNRSPTDKVVFIAVMTGLVDLPASCPDCNQPPLDGVCDEPEEFRMIAYVSYFDAEQDQDGDGRPDCDLGEAVFCVCFETKLKRVKLLEPCEESTSFVACLKPCASVPTKATGRAFFRLVAKDNKIWFLLTDQGLRDVTKATIQVAGTDVVKLAEQENGDCTGLLNCAYFYPKDFLGSWKGKSLGEAVKAIEDGKATVLVCTKQYSAGELTGKIEDP